MIDAEAIAQAEKLLRFVDGAEGMDTNQQFGHYSVDRQAYENFHQEIMALFIRRSQELNIPIPQKLVPVINTLMSHHFLVGVVCGRSTVVSL